MTSLAQILDYIKVALRKLPRTRTLDQLTLKLITRSHDGAVNDTRILYFFLRTQTFLTLLFVSRVSWW